MWVSVPPIPGAVIVNVGDCLMRWSNDVLVSNPHRVICDPAWRPSESESANGVLQPSRRSIAFFCNPNKSTTVECLAVCTSAERPPKYKPVNALEYLIGRLTDTI